MRKSGNRHTIDVIFVLTLACAFAASILMVLMLGANVYGNIQRTADTQFNDRVSISYIMTKIRSHDAVGAVRTGEFEGSSALFLDQEFYGEEFTTVIYTYDGWLRELFTDLESTRTENSWLTPDSGFPLIEVTYMSFGMMRPNLLTIDFIDTAGHSGQVFVNLRSARGGGL